MILFATLPVTAQIRTEFDRKMAEPFEPFEIIDNIYYVGTADAAVYLITSEQGHILLDGAFAETAPQIEDNIKKLGFKMEDIKILLNNHAHYDHAGGLALLKKRTGAKLYANRKQAEQLKRGGKQDFAFGDEIAFTPVKPDRRIRDKDEIRLGDVKLVVNYTPGHTKGSTTFKTTAKNGDSFYQVVFLSSLSVLDYDLVSNPNYRDIANDFRATFGFLRSLKVDIFLGSHASFFKMKEKAEALKSAPGINPFVDPEGYRSFILRNEKTFLEKLAKQQAGPAKAKQ